MLTRTAYRIALLAAAVCACINVAAQGPAPAHPRTPLEHLSTDLRARAESQRQQAYERAERAGIAIRRELPNGRIVELQRFDSQGLPVYYITHNLDAADTTSTDDVWPGGSAGLALDGGGLTLGIWDEAAVLDSHDEFTDGGANPSRVVQMDTPAGVSDHSSHVAGTMVASGFDPAARGMAPAADLNAWDWNFDIAEMAAAASGGLPVSNHSYGVAAGWFNIVDQACNNWWWLGGETTIEDYKFGYYDSDAQAWDQVAYNAPGYLIVKSAGNDRGIGNAGPGLNGDHCWLSADETTLTPSNMSRNSDCHDGVHPPGYDCLPTISVAKNILTVGAVDDIAGGYADFPGPSSVNMTAFSGWGPADDGRIKPDIVANGEQVYSSVPTWLFLGIIPLDYNIFSGTSMAAPNAAGSLLLLQQHHQTLNSGASMRAATLKALAIHTADEAGPAAGPDYVFGFGLLNTEIAARVIAENGSAHRIIEGTLSDGGAETVQINVNEPDSIVTATLVWADPPATPVAPAIDPTDPMLVNDLDLRIQGALTTHFPWVLNPAAPADPATTGDNTLDNVEQVVIDGAGPGAYFVEISHKGALQSGGPQDYSLIISVEPRPSGGTTEFMSEDFSGGLPPGWTVIPSPNGGPQWAIYADNDADPEQDNRTGGSGNYAMAHYGELQAPFDTELRSESYDLGLHAEVNLEFKSHFDWFQFERISVDVSNDGGTNWTQVWFHEQAPMPGPTTILLDISAVAAGQANVMIRFQFESVSELDGILWQVDDVRLMVPDAGDVGDPCAGEYNLPAGQWRFIALPCDPGVDNSVADLFGDDLDVGNYLFDWVLYERNEATDSYLQVPDTNHPLNQAEGYFLLSLNPGLLDMTGSPTPMASPADCHSPDGLCFEIPLVKNTDGTSPLSNALGHPLPFPVDWKNFRLRVVGEPSLLTPSEAEALDYAEKVVHKYSGSAYVPYDDVTPGYDHGALGAFDAFWLKTLEGSHAVGDMTLLVPNIRSGGVITTSGTASALQRDAGLNGNEKVPPGQAKRDAHREKHRAARQKGDEWFLRLVVASAVEELLDDGNVIGQLQDSVPGFDQHDLLEPAPFTPYLTVVFPQADWGEHAADYTSDFRAPTGNNKLEQWTFEVRSDDPAREVHLSWSGPDDVLRDSMLRDLDSGAVIEPGQQGGYSFVMEAEVRHFAWQYEKRPGKGKKK